MSASHARLALWGLLLAGAVAAAAGLYGVRPPSPAAADAPPDGPPIPVRADSEQPYRPLDYQMTTDQMVRLWEERVRNDPRDHLSLTTLASIYIRKARDCSDHTLYDKADDAFRRALVILPSHAAARIGLAHVTCARHRFSEGLTLAEAVYRDHPEEAESLAVIADARLELGDYAGAERAVRELDAKASKPTPPAVLARQARLAELHGNPDAAVKLLTTAAEESRRADEGKEAGAWFQMRLGEILASQGKLAEAAAHLDAALTDHPKYLAALVVLAAVRAAEGNFTEAIALYERAATITPDVAVLAALADLYARNGQEFLAKAHRDAVEAADTDATPFGRVLVLYYCDHDRKLTRALDLARREFAERKDVYGYDALAWALHKNGMPRDAEAAAVEALKLGTRDAMLHYHAGMIAAALGENDAARERLSRALAINPHFAHAAEARRALGRFGGPR